MLSELTTPGEPLSVQRRLLQLGANASSEPAYVRGLLGFVCELFGACLAVRARGLGDAAASTASGDETWNAVVDEQSFDESLTTDERLWFTDHLLQVAAEAMVHAEPRVRYFRRQAGFAVLAVPVPRATGSSALGVTTSGEPTANDDALAVLLRRDGDPIESFVMPLELIAHAFSAHLASSVNRRLEWEAETAAVIAELVASTLDQADASAACQTAARMLGHKFRLPEVAIGLSDERGKCRLLGKYHDCESSAASHAEVETAEYESAFQAALFGSSDVVCEAELVGTSEADSRWPASCRKLTERLGCARLLLLPLATANDDSVGVVAMAVSATDASGAEAATTTASSEQAERLDERCRELLKVFCAARQPLALALRRVRESPLDNGTMSRMRRAALRRRMLLMALIVIAAAGVLAIPFPYRMRCDCVAEPIARRYVAVPFDVDLLGTSVEPGDEVRQGDLLAELDGRTIRLEMATLAAERAQAVKQRDAKYAEQDVAGMQLAALEIERLDVKLRLLERQVAQLAVRSPIDGVVIAGDLQRAEGVPLQLGQTLFEIAPLDQVAIEVAVSDDDVMHARVGQPVDIFLDALSGDRRHGRIERIHPRSEVRDGQNVFVAEVTLDNPHKQLRPGMSGLARITADPHPLAWNLFHRAWQWLRTWG
ncbi:MAG: efflux RND transporter periplasmic adaptor subunit [Planctomycetales bacterium]|nr:efflux RND transporter periplasmic adaptor subunit [Planctomycetales bacterium]